MREEGYYWCLYNGEWDIYFYGVEKNNFIHLGIWRFRPDEFTVIDERQIKREEL